MNWDTFFKPSLKQVKPYEPGMREEQIREISKADTIYKLSSNESPFPPFPQAIEAMQHAIVGLNEYSDGGAYELKQTLSRYYDVSLAQIMVGNGTNELLDLIAESCLMPGDEALYCTPSFVVYKMSAQIADASFVEVPVAGDGAFDLDALAAAITPATKLVYICSPNNPTGGVVKKAAFDKFMQAVPDDVLVVVDNAYLEFVEPKEDTFDPFDYYDGTRPLVILRTFSKMYALAGIRVGYGFAPEPVVQAIDKVREPFNVNAVAQAAGCACLAGDAQKELERRRDINTACRERLQECFDELGLRTYPSSANFIWVFVNDVQGTFDALLERGIIVRPMPPAGGVRVGVGDEPGTKATIEAFQDIFGGEKNQ